jgi:hypothetical protein
MNTKGGGGIVTLLLVISHQCACAVYAHGLLNLMFTS